MFQTTPQSMPSPVPIEGPASRNQMLLADDLHKSYGQRPALKGLTFSMEAGRILGFLGPNGAGKTTAIRILTTILEPTKGRFVVDGIGSEHPREIRRRIGVLPESLGFPKSNTAREHLVYFGELYGLTPKEARRRAVALLEEVGLQERGKNLIGTYSRGMRQRLGIARALLNDPAVVFLDEPTLGLDPRGQKELLDLVRRVPRERNASIVLCSHLLSEVEAVCDDVVILSLGQVVARGSVAEVVGQARKNGMQAHRLRIEVPAGAAQHARRVLEAAPEVRAVIPVAGSAGGLAVELADPPGETTPPGEHVNNRILDALIRASIPVMRFETETGRLHEAFLHLTDEVIK